MPKPDSNPGQYDPGLAALAAICVPPPGTTVNCELATATSGDLGVFDVIALGGSCTVFTIGAGRTAPGELAAAFPAAIGGGSAVIDAAWPD